MRVAVVGANLLGCATAFYVRQSLEANQPTRKTLKRNATGEAGEAGEASQDGDASKEDERDEIVIFDEKSRAGGNKFVTLSLGDVTAPCGTAASVDIASTPVLKSLLDTADIALQLPRAPPEWSVFDWDADACRLSRSGSRLLSAVLSSTVGLIALQLFALASTFFFAPRLFKHGINVFFVQKVPKARVGVPTFQYSVFLWFLSSALLAFGLVPVTTLLRAYNYLYMRLHVKLLSSILYGAPTLFSLSKLYEDFSEQLSLIVQNDSASSCVTVGHLLSACGLAKFAKQSAAEFFLPLQIRGPFLADCLSPSLSLAHANSRVTASGDTSALACMLSLIAHAPIPEYIRAKARFLSAEDTVRLCPRLVDAASADLRLGTRVVSVKKAEGSRYDVRGVVDGKEMSLGLFDSVVLAAVVDTAEFESDALDSDCRTVFALSLETDSLTGDSSPTVNTARYVSLVRGTIKASFFRQGIEDDMPDRTFILNSVNCSEVVRAGINVWKVTSSERPEVGSALCATLFESVEEVAVLERSKRRYPCTFLRNVNGAESPVIILGRRFINVAATDRICNDVNMDCLAARNAASFFRAEVATWK